MEETIKGSQSLIFRNAPYLISAASVTGSKEAEGPLGKLFDMTSEDDLFGAQTWEEAESTMQKEACVLALGKAHVEPAAVRYLFGGDLLRQGIATSMGVEGLQIPMFGLYGACSTSGEALALAAMSAAAGYGEYMLAVTSSHFGSAEKEFRFPLGYASQRPLSAHWTVTGSGAFLVGSAEKPGGDGPGGTPSDSSTPNHHGRTIPADTNTSDTFMTERTPGEPCRNTQDSHTPARSAGAPSRACCA